MKFDGHPGRPFNTPSRTANGGSFSPAWISQELIGDTIRVWQPYYPETLTEDIALEMLTNTGYLFDALGHLIGVAS